MPLCCVRINVSDVHVKEEGLVGELRGEGPELTACPAPGRPRLLVGWCGLTVLFWAGEGTEALRS